MAEQILMIGNDGSLLDIRAKVLSLAGWQVKTVCRPTASMQVSPEGSFRLGILCHTLTPRERRDVLESIRAKWPAARLISLNSIRVDRLDVPPDVTVLDGLHPAMLVATCQRLLDEAGASSEAAPS